MSVRTLRALTLTFLALFAMPFAQAAGGTLIGKTLTRIPGGDNFLTRALVQPDGKIVVAGGVRSGNLQYQITRYNTDGTLDTGFNGTGTILEPLGSGDGQAWAVALQADGRIVVAGNVRSDRDKFGIARFNSDGTLDLTFGGGGSAKSAGPGDAGAYAMAIQADGKIVLGGYSMTAASGGRKVFTLARYNTNDTIDTTFGVNGFAIAAAGASDEQVNSLGIQADGRIVAAGSMGAGGTRFMRFNTDGTVDGTWITTSVGYLTGARDLVVQADGRIAVVGNVNGGSVSEVGVLRMNANGTIDTSFGGGACALGPCPGVAHMPISDAVAGYGLALQSGKYVVSGDTVRPAGLGSAVALGRFTSTGAVDTTFGSSGIVVSQPAGSGDAGRGLAIRADGRIVIAGQANGAFGDYDSLVVAFTANGVLDSTFNGTGFSKLDAGTMSGQWRAAALQGDGKVVAAGFTVAESHTSTPGTKGGVMARFLANGTLDAAFGTNGIVQFAWPANAVAIQGDGKIVVGGYSPSGSPAKPSMTFARYATNGALDTSFGSAGTTVIAPATADERINAIAIQGDGRIVGAGFVTGTYLDSAFVRLTTSGALDSTFNSNGVAIVAMSTGADSVASVAVQPDGKIVGAGTADVSVSQQSMSVTRLNANGTIDAAFGTNGVAAIGFGAATSNAHAMLLQPDGRIVVAGKVFNAANATDDFAIARLTAAGALDGSFGTNGVSSNDFDNHNRIFALARLPSGKLIGAGETGGFFALVQYLANGTLDTGFGTGGSSAEQVNSGNDYANAIAVGADGTLYLAGNGSGALALARFTSDVAATTADVAITQVASSTSLTVGQNVTFTLTVSNAGPGGADAVTVTDTLPAGLAFVAASAGCSNASGTVTCALGTLANGASTQVTITARATAAGSIMNSASVSATQTDPSTSNNTAVAGITVTAAPTTLSNISTRGLVGTGNNVLIGGFVIGGTGSKTVIVTVAGPSLSAYGITNPLANPKVTLVRSSDQSAIATNDNWGDAANAAQVQASGFAPASSLEPAILVTLPPGAYTAIAEGVGGTGGVAVVGVYEIDHPETPLVNISTRGNVLTGNDVMIGGFVIQGSTPQTVIITGTGPSLANYGITNPLANPTLTLVRSSDQSVVATNDNWGDAPNAAQIQSAGFAPSDARESAIMVTLPPGAYTAILAGAGGGTGIGVVAVYRQ